nr:hypothetical protein [Candidatus Sigynarchaeota archaeon]
FTVDFNKDRDVLAIESVYLFRSTREPIRWSYAVKNFTLSHVAAVMIHVKFKNPSGKRKLLMVGVYIETFEPVQLYQTWSEEDAETMRQKIAKLLWGDPGKVYAPD